MQTSARFGINYPSADRSDTADVPRDFASVVAGIEIAAMYSQGTLALRPTSTPGSPGKQGRFYMATDQTPHALYYDFGTGWDSVGSLGAGSVGTTQLADGAVTTIKIADGAVTGGAAGAGVKIAGATITHDNIVAATIRATELAAALQPSLGAGAGTEALRALGTGAGTAAAGTHASQHGAAGADPLDPVIATIPVGGVIDWPWASGSIPAWSSLPYGEAIAQAGHTTLTNLDTASGHPHGVSAGNIVLPDYRGRVGVGKDDMGGTAANRITVAVSGVSGATLGAVFGAEGITLTTGQLPAHNHAVTGAPGFSDPQHQHGINTWTSGSGAGSSGHVQDDTQAGPINLGITTNTAFQPTGISTSVGSLGTANAGSGSAHQNTQPSIIVNKIMRVV
jgi:microcystin-dependent protein